MNLYILRHAIAVPHGAPRFKDENRPLTKDGARKMKAIAEGMLALKLDFDRVASSPYVRARETAEIVGKAFDQKVELWPSLIPTEDPRQLVAALRKSIGQNLLLVGHEPHLSEFISVLVCGSSGAGFELKKGGLCKLSSADPIYGQCAKLHWLLAPAQLRALR